MKKNGFVPDELFEMLWEKLQVSLYRYGFFIEASRDRLALHVILLQ